jgi:hypothetical protein
MLPQYTTTKEHLEGLKAQRGSTRENPATIEQFFPYDELKNKGDDELPDGVDEWRKEAYLDSSTFVEVMGMTSLEFSTMPQWKQDKKKREVGLF